MPSANAGDGARQSFVSPPEDDRDTLEGMTGTPLPASTGFNQRLQNTGVGPTTVIDDRRPKLGRLPKGLYAATAQDDNVAAEQQLARASVSVPGQLPVAAGVGDIQGAAAMAILAPPPAPYRSRAVRPRNAAKEFANVSADQEMAQPRPPIVPGDNIPEMMQKYNQRRAARLRGSP